MKHSGFAARGWGNLWRRTGDISMCGSKRGWGTEGCYDGKAVLVKSAGKGGRNCVKFGMMKGTIRGKGAEWEDVE